ncbi:MAG: PepSY domain-containing protein [Beijerinckiaceae bacterium]
MAWPWQNSGNARELPTNLAAMHIQFLSPTLIAGALLLNSAVSLLTLAQGSPGASAPVTPCTVHARELWLPLRTIVSRLEDEGWIVLRRSAGDESCYTLSANRRDGAERLLVIDPVSGKVRAEMAP